VHHEVRHTYLLECVVGAGFQVVLGVVRWGLPALLVPYMILVRIPPGVSTERRRHKRIVVKCAGVIAGVLEDLGKKTVIGHNATPVLGVSVLHERCNGPN
jgi:hypothetical protein